VPIPLGEITIKLLRTSAKQATKCQRSPLKCNTFHVCDICFCKHTELLWVAPELLPLTIVPGTPATQKGDVYSFAIILEEIIVRGGPYEAASQFLGPQGKLDYALSVCFVRDSVHA